MGTVRQEAWDRLVYDPENDEFEAHVLAGMTRSPVTRPISAGCLLTGKCNLKCGFCYGNDESLPRNDITSDEWARIFQRLSSWGLMRVDLSGGEPTIRKDLPQIAAAAIESGLNVVISTNGLILGQPDLISFPSVRWHVSIDSGLPDVHEKSRVLRTLAPSGGSFEKTTDFVLACLKQGQRTRVLTCLGTHNTNQLFTLGEHLALVGVPEWSISRILPAGRAQAGYERLWRVTNDEVLEQVAELRRAFPFIRYSNRTDQNAYFLRAA